MKTDREEIQELLAVKLREVKNNLRINYVAVDADGLVYGFKYKPKHYSNGWSQSIEHPECEVYDFHYGIIKHNDTSNVNKMLFKFEDIIYTYEYDFKYARSLYTEDQLIKIASYGGAASDKWFAVQPNGSYYIYPSEPFLNNGLFRVEGRSHFLNIKENLSPSSNKWNRSKIKISDITEYFESPKEEEPADSTADVVKYLKESIKARELNISQIQAEINAMQRVIELLN